MCNFKAGDKVLCIDPVPSKNLLQGEVYEVDTCVDGAGYTRTGTAMIFPKELAPVWFYASRFVLHEES